MKPSLPETSCGLGVALAVAAAAADAADAADDVEGGKCWCWTGGSSLSMHRWLGVADVCTGDGECLHLVGVSGAPRAAAAVTPAAVAPAAAAVCVGSGAGKVGACASGLVVAAAADGGGRLAKLLPELLPQPTGLAGVGEAACRQVLAEGVGNQLPLSKFDQDCCPPGLHHQSLSVPIFLPRRLCSWMARSTSAICRCVLFSTRTACAALLLLWNPPKEKDHDLEAY
eukprot:1142054-Pelagomonas_calceolata.AAC.1